MPRRYSLIDTRLLVLYLLINPIVVHVLLASRQWRARSITILRPIASQRRCSSGAARPIPAARDVTTPAFADPAQSPSPPERLTLPIERFRRCFAQKPVRYAKNAWKTRLNGVGAG